LNKNVLFLSILYFFSYQLDFTEQFLSALHFLQQADNHMSVGNTARAVELLKLVNEEATKGSPITEDLVICPKVAARRSMQQ